MKDKSNSKPEIPLSINILRLQNYKLSPDETVFFDWLIVKSISFGYKKFHYSQARIEKETRIKRTRQDTIIRKFCYELMFLNSTVEEHVYTKGRVRFFFVNFKQLTDKDVLSEIIEPESKLFSNFIAYFEYHSEVQKKISKTENAAKTTDDISDSDEIYYSLDDVYETRRKMYNSGKITGSKPERLKLETQMQRNKIINKKLIKLSQVYDDNAVRHSFTAYIDAVFKGDEMPKNIMYFFLTFDDVNGSFPIVDKYLNHFNLNYSYSE